MKGLELSLKAFALRNSITVFKGVKLNLHPARRELRRVRQL
jgi:hypothetical protein